jgi:hypothetical protein
VEGKYDFSGLDDKIPLDEHEDLIEIEGNL